MGSFTTTPKILNEDMQDNDIDIPLSCTKDLLLKICNQNLHGKPSILHRKFKYTDANTKYFYPTAPNNTMVRIMQWNILAQALGEHNDSFVACPLEALDWKYRRFRLLQELVKYEADIFCLQEVDHFMFFQTTLGAIGYKGIFFPKPDSPCLYVPRNNGADGCAIFYNSRIFDVVRVETRVLEVWSVQSNQVAILVILRVRSTGQSFCVVTTHLKARQGSILSTLRNEQGKDLLQFVRVNCSQDMPIFVCGDFNAEPNEPVYSAMTNCGKDFVGFKSAYKTMYGEEPDYTTWKIREEGEICHTIDYIFFSSQHCSPESVLLLPSGDDIGVGRIPSLEYPSDHFSLICDFSFL
uniref:Nocturnin n=1 Tax=Strigamia maritima TaxID=126957 RepID=T1J2V4_STRMM